MEWTNEMVEAAHSGKINKLRGLLSTGVDPNSRGQIQAPIRGACTASRTALHVAAIALQCECILELVRHGAYVNIQDEDGYTPAHYVCQKYISSDEEGARASECLKVLFKFGGSVRIKTYNGALSLLDLATRSGNLACLKVIEKEASTVGSLKNICRCGIVDYLHRCCSGVHLIDQLPLPNALKKYLEYYDAIAVAMSDH